MLFQKSIIRTIFAIYRYIVLSRAVPKLRHYTCRLGYIGLQNGRRAGVKSLLCLFRLFDWRERVRVQFNICSNQFFIGHSCSQVEVKTLYDRHYDLVNSCEIFISQMTMDLFLYTQNFPSSITDKTQALVNGLLSRLLAFWTQSQSIKVTVGLFNNNVIIK